MNDDQARRRRSGDHDFPRGHDDDSFNDQRNPQPGLGNRPRHWQGRGTGERGPWHDEPEFDRRYPAGPGNQYGRAGDYGRGHGHAAESEPYGGSGRGGPGRSSQGRASPQYADEDFGRGREEMRDEGYAGRGYPREHVHQQDELLPGRRFGGRHPGGDWRSDDWRSDDWSPGGRHSGGRHSGGQRPGGQHFGAHNIGPDERLYSRSADPGQSSYGGFRNEDTRYQAQQEPRQQRILPKGYTRSDERLREDVCERLAHSGLDVGDVSVSVSEGRVTLEGAVKDRASKHAIENCVDDCLGVQDIDNRIRVNRDGGGKPVSIGA